MPGRLTAEGAKNLGGKGFKGLMATLKGAAFGGAMLAILGFMNSPYWDKMLKLINDDIIPAVQYLFETVLVPIGNFLKDSFLRVEDIGALFDGIGDAITKFQEGDVLGGITTLIGSLSMFFINTIDNLITGVFNLFGGIFGLEKTDSVFGEIGRFVTDTYNSIVNFLSNAFNFAKILSLVHGLVLKISFKVSLMLLLDFLLVHLLGLKMQLYPHGKVYRTLQTHMIK